MAKDKEWLEGWLSRLSDDVGRLNSSSDDDNGQEQGENTQAAAAADTVDPLPVADSSPARAASDSESSSSTPDTPTHEPSQHISLLDVSNALSSLANLVGSLASAIRPTRERVEESAVSAQPEAPLPAAEATTQLHNTAPAAQATAQPESATPTGQENAAGPSGAQKNCPPNFS